MYITTAKVRLSIVAAYHTLMAQLFGQYIHTETGWENTPHTDELLKYEDAVYRYRGQIIKAPRNIGKD